MENIIAIFALVICIAAIFSNLNKKKDPFDQMTEQQIQKKRIDQLESEGYYVIKLIKTNKNGIPDIVAIPPNCGVIFSEVKTPKGRVSTLQEYRLKELKKHGLETEIYRG